MSLRRQKFVRKKIILLKWAKQRASLTGDLTAGQIPMKIIIFSLCDHLRGTESVVQNAFCFCS